MDLGAYTQIEDLQKVAAANGIAIPRLRGYRLMKNEPKASEEDIAEILKGSEIDTAEWLCETVPLFTPHSYWTEIGERTHRVKTRYLTCDSRDKAAKTRRRYSGIRWDKIHGKKRKILKFEIKKQQQKIKKQMNTFNKYAGREDVLYIHSRMGGNNWKNYDGKQELMSKPWFLERVDDACDDTYCDFYAKIDPKTIGDGE